jgi:hypothetical protein
MLVVQFQERQKLHPAADALNAEAGSSKGTKGKKKENLCGPVLERWIIDMEKGEPYKKTTPFPGKLAGRPTSSTQAPSSVPHCPLGNTGKFLKLQN